MEQDKYITQFSTYLFWDVKKRRFRYGKNLIDI